MLVVDTTALGPFLPDAEFNAILPEVAAAHDALNAGTCKGGAYLGWLTWPENYDRAEFKRIQKAAAAIRAQSKVLVVVGIGGSYLGARAALEFLKSPFYNQLTEGTEIYFAGNNLGAAYLNQIVALIGERDFSVNVISKSGTTTEPAIAFRLFRERLVHKYGKEGAAKRIFATTDASRGALKALAGREGYETFVIPDDIGGRFSVLTAVGLLPLAVAGIDVEAMMLGAEEAMAAYNTHRTLENPAWKYAAARNLLYRTGYAIEVLASYEPSFRFMAEWWKQLYGESEGKDGKGIFPASIDLTADLHSMGQYMQDGKRNLFETIVVPKEPTGTLAIPHDPDNSDGLNFLSGMDIDAVNREALRGTVAAHVDGGVPCILIRPDAFEERSLGQLIYFYELACGISGLVLGVNPFDQPGVEAYKINMFALLNKPGFEAQGKALRSKLTKLGL
jgi:glucose-6-phosphate isomerase